MSKPDEQNEPYRDGRKRTWLEELLRRHGICDAGVTLVVHQRRVVRVVVEKSGSWEQLEEELSSHLVDKPMDYGRIEIVMEGQQVTRIDVKTSIRWDDPNKTDLEFGATLLANTFFEEA